MRNIRSEIVLIVWDKFHEAGVKFPFPQRDLHVKGPVEVTMAERGGKCDVMVFRFQEEEMMRPIVGSSKQERLFEAFVSWSRLLELG